MSYYSEHKPSFVLTKQAKVEKKTLGPKSDQDVELDLVSRLQALHGIDTSRIELQVLKGRVLLTGKVSSQRVKTLVESLVDNTVGVRGVKSEIQVV